MIWFTADTHFGHKNIIKYSNRPFSSVEEMDETLINNINIRVGENDTLYHLGDFSFSRDIKYYRNKIKCKNLILILGNHDRLNYEDKKLFSRIYNLYELRLPNKQCITLCHYAMKVWNKSHHGAWHLYGHNHGSLNDSLFPSSMSFDVGVDCHKYRPISLDDVNKIMSEKKFVKVDHHG